MVSQSGVKWEVAADLKGCERFFPIPTTKSQTCWWWTRKRKRCTCWSSWCLMKTMSVRRMSGKAILMESVRRRGGKQRISHSKLATEDSSRQASQSGWEWQDLVQRKEHNDKSSPGDCWESKSLDMGEEKRYQLEWVLMVNKKSSQLNWQGDLTSVMGSARHKSCREEEPERATHFLLIISSPESCIRSCQLKAVQEAVIDLSIHLFLPLPPPLCVCVCVSVCVPVSVSVCVCLSLSLSISLSLSVCPSVCLPACLSVYLSICLSVCLSVCLSPSLLPAPLLSLCLLCVPRTSLPIYSTLHIPCCSEGESRPTQHGTRRASATYNPQAWRNLFSSLYPDTTNRHAVTDLQQARSKVGVMFPGNQVTHGPGFLSCPCLLCPSPFPPLLPLCPSLCVCSPLAWRHFHPWCSSLALCLLLRFMLSSPFTHSSPFMYFFFVMLSSPIAPSSPMTPSSPFMPPLCLFYPLHLCHSFSVCFLFMLPSPFKPFSLITMSSNTSPLAGR